MEEKTFVGFDFGVFTDDAGAAHEYCNVYLLEPFVGEPSDIRHFGGLRAMKYKCDDPSIFEKITPNTRVRCYFSSRGKVAFMQPIDKQAAGKD